MVFMIQKNAFERFLLILISHTFYIYMMFLVSYNNVLN